MAPVRPAQPRNTQERSSGWIFVQPEGHGLQLMENLRNAMYGRLVCRALARQGEQFAHVKAKAPVTARTLTGWSAVSPMASNQ